MKELMDHKKVKEEKDPKGTPSHRKDRPPTAYLQWMEKGSAAGEDDWGDWFEVENKWRDNIVPSNND